jgi:hypothetical protein
MLTASLAATASDALANAPIGESLWRQAETDTRGELSREVDHRESDGYIFQAVGTPQAVTLHANKPGRPFYGVTFDAPGSADLVVGQVYPDGLLSIDSSCEDTRDGAFQIHELTFDPVTSEITHLSATFHYFCADSVPDGTRFVATVAFEPEDGALPLPKYGSLNGEPLTRVTLDFDPSHIIYGNRAVAKGLLSVRDTGAPLGDQKVVLAQSADFNNWDVIERTVTSSLGRYAIGFRPKTTERYRVEFRGSSVGTRSTSFVHKAYVHYGVSAHLSDTRVKVGEPVIVRGHIKPGDRRGSTVRLQERVDGSWVDVLRKGARSDGTFRMRIFVNSVARVRLRVYCDPTPGLLQGVSDSMRLVAR